MKVFLSWSGARSKKVALIFKDWLPSVIQSIDAFVSSEDIGKGSRWSTDIAQELEESKFGVICVTKENFSAPWLNFEAGALSKTIENTYVAPFLLDIEPSALAKTPISQFQATSFNKADLKRLVETLNIADGNFLPPRRLDAAFELCYAKLEEQLGKLLVEQSKTENVIVAPAELPVNSGILEEILEISRNTQRLVENTDAKPYNDFEMLQKKIEEVLSKKDSQGHANSVEFSRRWFHSKSDDPIFAIINGNFYSYLFPYNMLILLSIYRENFPWIYDAGKNLVSILVSTASKESKFESILRFEKLLDFTFMIASIRTTSECYTEEERTLFSYLDHALAQAREKVKRSAK